MLIRSAFSLRSLALLSAGVIWLAFASAARGETNDFERACSAYDTRDFAGAAQLFGDEIKRAPSAEAWRNLGNAKWQAGHPGPAILAWERALWINPYDADAAASLRFARQSAQLAELPLRWWETFSTCLPANAWAWLAVGSLWLTIALGFVLPIILGRRRTAWTQSLAAIAFGGLLLTITGAAGIHTRTALGVVWSGGTPLLQVPTHHAQTLARLPAGEAIHSRYRRGNYFFVRTSSAGSGWVEETRLRFISSPGH